MLTAPLVKKHKKREYGDAGNNNEIYVEMVVLRNIMRDRYNSCKNNDRYLPMLSKTITPIVQEVERKNDESCSEEKDLENPLL